MNITVKYLVEAQKYIALMPEKARRKMFYNISLVTMGVVDARIFKKLSNSGIWEFWAEYESNEYRLLAFGDKTSASVVVATHGFDKKIQKTPQQEIEHAEIIRDRYYGQK